MSNIPDINSLLDLARMKITDKEKEKLENDIKGILDYVEQIEEASVDMDVRAKTGVLYNVMRDDVSPHESGMYTDLILQSAPVTKDGYIQVKKII